MFIKPKQKPASKYVSLLLRKIVCPVRKADFQLLRSLSSNSLGINLQC